jgi:cytochrome c
MSLHYDRSRRIAVSAFLVFAAAGYAETAPLTDAQAKKLFNARSCNACHALDETRIGPAYRTVGLRYRDAPADTVSWLATKIISGGAGSWGTVPMVSNPGVSPDEARAIARWILGLGKAQPQP